MNYPDDFIDKIIQGDVLDVLKDIPDNSIDTIITSPPYWGLRDYGEEANTIWGGDPNCEHEWEIEIKKNPKDRGGKGQHDVGGIVGKMGKTTGTNTKVKSGFCKKCGAWYGQLGLEPTLNMYIDHTLQITAELKRVLKKTGVMFWNHGDCYGRSECGNGGKSNNKRSLSNPNLYCEKPNPQPKLTHKCMTLQNYRLVLRMMDEQGWILRNTIIWHKPNPMPSSVKDRFANAYEPVFMLVKNKKYYFDLDAMRVPQKSLDRAGKVIKKTANEKDPFQNKFNKTLTERYGGIYTPSPLGKNPGDVWTIPTQPFPEAHFATYPEKLIEPMIKAGCPQWICKKCGKARERITKTEYDILRKSRIQYQPKQRVRNDKFGFTKGAVAQSKHYTIGWTDCGCNAGWDAGVVLDPFAGSGTTCYVARKLGRYYIGIEINPEYVKMARRRLANLGARLEKYF